ncbi:MAG: hypothetical protein ACR2JF_14450 [Iamia sp.]
MASAISLLVFIGYAVSSIEPEAEHRVVQVPPGGEVVLDEVGRYSVRYLSPSWVAAGLCERRVPIGTDNSRPYYECDRSRLALPNRLTIRDEAGRPLRLIPADGFEDEEAIEVWELDVAEETRAEVEMPEPPEATEALAVVFEGDDEQSVGQVVSLLLFPFLFLMGLVVLFITVVRSAARKRAAAPPLAPITGWAPPSGPPVTGSPLAPTTFPGSQPPGPGVWPPPPPPPGQGGGPPG